ncbi:Putative pentatricopeptide repeat-containing protein At1g68930 [Linum perenne]
MYGRCGCLEDAAQLFDEMPQRDLFAAVLAWWHWCWQLHGMAIKLGFDVNVYVGNALIDMYGKCGSLDDAEQVLEMMPERDNVSWNSLIAACCGNGMVDKALECFDKMVAFDGLTPNLVTWSTVIGGFAQNGYDEEAVKLLSRMQAEGSSTECTDFSKVRRLIRLRFPEACSLIRLSGGALWKMYCKCRDLVAAELAFGEVVEKEISTWNALISGILAGHLENGEVDLVMQSLLEMQASNSCPDIYTLGIVLPACSRLATLGRGKQVQCSLDIEEVTILMFISELLLWICIPNVGALKYAMIAYNRIRKPNLVCHNAMLTAYATHGYGAEGIALFQEFLPLDPDQMSLKPTLKHFTAMVDLLSRSGKLTDAYELIQTMPMKPDSVLWGALLGGNECNAECEEGPRTLLLQLLNKTDKVAKDKAEKAAASALEAD